MHLQEAKTSSFSRNFEALSPASSCLVQVIFKSDNDQPIYSVSQDLLRWKYSIFVPFSYLKLKSHINNSFFTTNGLKSRKYFPSKSMNY